MEGEGQRRIYRAIDHIDRRLLGVGTASESLVLSPPIVYNLALMYTIT